MINTTIKFAITGVKQKNSTRVVPDSDPTEEETIAVSEVILTPVPGEKLRDENGAEQAVTHKPWAKMRLGGLAVVDGFELPLNTKFDVTFKELAAE